MRKRKKREKIDYSFFLIGIVLILIFVELYFIVRLWAHVL